MTDSNCVLAKVPLQLIENILREFQLCLSQETIASHQKYSKTNPYCVLAKIPLQLIEINLRQFHIVS